MKRVIVMLATGGLMLGACSKAQEATAQAPQSGPDNAFTRYGENLAHDQQRAQDVTNNANAVIAGQQKQMDQEAGQN